MDSNLKLSAPIGTDVTPSPQQIEHDVRQAAVAAPSRSHAVNARKIALFVPDLSGGGAERVTVNLAHGFAERGFSVDIVMIRKEGVYLSTVASPVRIVNLNAGRSLRSIWPLVRYLYRERPAALLSIFVSTNLVAIVARSLARVPTRIVFGEHSPPSHRQASSESLLTRPARWLRPRFYRRADGIVAVSHGVAQDLVDNIEVPPDRLHVINNPIVTPELHRQASEPIDHPWFAPGQPPVVLGVGRLAYVKDFPTLIRAFAKVRQQRPVKLVILGEGEDRPILERLRDELGLHEDMDLPGFVANPYGFMARAAALVLSWRWEGSPSVLVEAMACGTAVIATDCPGGAAEILDGGRFGTLVPIHDTDALAESIARTLEAPLATEILRERANDFTVARAVDQYLRVLLGDSGA